MISAVAGNVSLRCAATTCTARAVRRHTHARTHARQQATEGSTRGEARRDWPARGRWDGSQERPQAHAQPGRKSNLHPRSVHVHLCFRVRLKGVGIGVPWVVAASTAISFSSFTAMLALASYLTHRTSVNYRNLFTYIIKLKASYRNSCSAPCIGCSSARVRPRKAFSPPPFGKFGGAS